MRALLVRCLYVGEDCVTKGRFRGGACAVGVA